MRCQRRITAAGQELVRELAGRLGASYRYLHGPALLRSGAVRATLLAEPSMARVVARARSADVALVRDQTIGSGATAMTGWSRTRPSLTRS